MDLILGIDFGTTNTVVTYFQNNKPNLLLDGIYKSIPSKIGIKNEMLFCGNYIPLKPDFVIDNFKTIIGQSFNPIIVGNKTLLLNDILIIFFDHIKKIINKKFDSTYNLKTIITVPSNFNDKQRETIRNAFNHCKFNVLRIINEPSAAALSYGLSNINEEEERILVIDTGGGTMDLTVLVKEDGLFQVEHSVGLNDLGGNNFTDCIYEYILKQNKSDKNQVSDKVSDKNQVLWYNCQIAKEKLSWLDNYEIKFNNNNFNISQKLFEKLVNNLINRVEEILKEIKNLYESYKYIIMVGNTSKIPILQKIVFDIFNIKPWIHPNLESVVAEGACLYGAIAENIFKSDNNVVLVDVVPLSLGIETSDGSFSIIIPKNTPLPVKKTARYTTDSPSDNSVTVKIYQGERKIANKNTLIGEYIFDKITTGGTPIIDITFKIDLNGIINIIIVDKKSLIEKNILIKDIPVIDTEQLELILLEAENNENIDEEEMLIKSRLYQINAKIEIVLNNIKFNNLLSEIKKQEYYDIILDLESKIENANSTILLNIIKEINEKFNTLQTENLEEESVDNSSSIDKIILFELKEELENKVKMLLAKNPEWNEYLNPILEELQLNNITKEYIEDKMNIIKDLDDNNENQDYKEQFKNVCLFIKNEINCGNINLDLENMIKLNQLIIDALILIDSETESIDWEIELDNFNKKCELLL
jgi:molecular chaperone DnaK